MGRRDGCDTRHGSGVVGTSYIEVEGGRGQVTVPTLGLGRGGGKSHYLRWGWGGEGKPHCLCQVRGSGGKSQESPG